MTENREVRYGYFVVQVRAGAGLDPRDVSGVVENLGTGIRAEFQSTEELARSIGDWAAERGAVSNESR